MVVLPPDLGLIIKVFAPLFSRRVWHSAQVLLMGAILAPGHRTVAAVLRILGLGQERRFKTYHRVLSRARWSALAASRILLRLLVQRFAAAGPVVMGLDDTIERRRGEKIAARGIYRDPIRSSHSQFVKVSGLRWLSLMLLVPIPWAKRVWALPFLTALCPSERYYAQRQRVHRPLTERARQVLRVVQRWLPGRTMVVTADSSFAALELLAALPQQLAVVTRLRLDAALYEPALTPRPGQWGRPRKKGNRLPTLAHVLADPQTRWTCLTLPVWYSHPNRPVELTSGTAVWYHTGKPPVAIRWVVVRDPQGKFDPQAFLCTDREASPVAILTWFVQRWQLEVTFHEVRAQLGVETQRQWSDSAIARTTPTLLALFSIVTLMAHHLIHSQPLPVRTAAWYTKRQPTFSDALAWVRTHLWQSMTFSLSVAKADSGKVPAALLERLTEALCYAA